MFQRRISVGPGGEMLWISSEYNDEIRLTIKSFAGARWDGQRRVWQVPVRHRAKLLEHLARFQFEVEADVADSGDEILPKVDPETLSISQVNTQIGASLARRFPSAIWIRGELASFDKGVRRKHWYNRSSLFCMW